ncbi:MAG: hypothetical protein PHS30_01885 [Bacteroidales bacterium]|nr:hypothetical protein [Bacteroidales bacterium]
MKYFGYLVALMAFLFGTEYFVMKYLCPEYLFPLLTAIPLFFLLIGFLSIRFVYTKPSVSITMLMGVKTLKILISMVIILLYVVLIKEQSVSFLFSFLYYFITYLAFETWMMYAINKKKSTKKNEQQ